MHTLIDFLNHGILPFAGRSREIAALLAFWRGTFEAQELRAALLLGEAGIGKSRLLAEVLPRIVRDGGGVVHTRLYPESTFSIAPLIAGALWVSEAGRRLLREEPDGNLPSVTGALRRLARLRPTLLVIEDIHLLRGDAMKEFAALLNAVADETLSILCVARPVELEARPALERYITEEIRLEGLRSDELGNLWREMFRSTPGSELLEPLLEHTLGNPLALRSAIRSALKSGAIIGEQEGWRLGVSQERFDDMLGRSVGLLSEGLAAELGREERAAAARLATLGEVFSREAARVMVEDADRMVDLLTFKGIVVPSSLAPQPLPGGESAFPLLAFTHTLLHRYCAEHSSPDAGRLVRVIARDLPLYSVLPFELLGSAGEPGEATPEEIDGAIHRALRVAQAIDYTPAWEQTTIFLRMAHRLAEMLRGSLSADQEHRLELALLQSRMSLNRRRVEGEEFREAVMRMLELTNDPQSEEVAGYRLASLCRLRGVIQRYDREESWQIWRESEELVERFPSLRSTISYLYFLQDAANGAASVADQDMLRLVEERLESVLTQGEMEEKHRRYALTRVYPFLLLVFSTPEELDRRMRMLAEAEAVVDERDLTFLILKTGFLARIGLIDAMLRLSERSLPLFIERGTLRNFYTGTVYQLCGRAAFGADLDELEEEARRLAREAPAELAPTFRQFVAAGFATIALLRDEPAWGRRIWREFAQEGEEPEPMHAILLALDEDPDLLNAMAPDGDDGGAPELVRLATGAPDADHERARREGIAILSLPTLRLVELVSARAVIDLVEYIGTGPGHYGFAESLRDPITARLREILAWLDERELFAYIRPLVDRYRHYLTGAEAGRWEERADRIAAQRRTPAIESGYDSRIAVSMLGTITIQHAGAPPERLRGGRLSALLGLLVADRMLDRSLAHREFCVIATGNEEEPERARKSLNKAVQRLREALGGEAILTDGETPRLNLDRVQVDLLEAHRMLAEASAGVRAGLLMRAVPPLRRALELSRGEVPFPSLYDGFFEAAREDFELRLRTATIDVTRALLREGDAGGAAELLELATGLMPGDEGLAEMLRGALVALGRNTDAERIRLQSSSL